VKHNPCSLMPHVLKLKNTTQTLSLLHLFPVNFCGFYDGNKACGAGTVTLPLSLYPESVSLVSFNLQFSSSYSHQLSGLEGKNGNPTPILKISKPRSNSKTSSLARVCLGRPGSLSTRRVDRVSPGQLPGEFLLRPRPGSAGSQVDPPGQSGF